MTMFQKLGAAVPLPPWGYYNPSQCWELLTQWHDITSLRACIINNTSVTIKKNWNSKCRIPLVQLHLLMLTVMLFTINNTNRKHYFSFRHYRNCIKGTLEGAYIFKRI
jgi:hypothetical protein